MLKAHKQENFFGATFLFLAKLSFPMENLMFFTKKSIWIPSIQGAGVASVHSKYAHQQIQRILSKSCWCAYLVCAEIADAHT